MWVGVEMKRAIGFTLVMIWVWIVVLFGPKHSRPTTKSGGGKAHGGGPSTGRVNGVVL